MMTAATVVSTSAATAAVNLCAQALKALSERCPFDNEESSSRVPTLPFRVAAHLWRNSEGRRKLKKSASGHGEQALKAASPQAAKKGKGINMWDLMEVYFRPITEADIESLKPRGLLDSCLSIPVLEDSLPVEQKDVSFSGSEVGVSSEAVKEEEERSEKGEGQQPMEIDSVENFTTTDTSTLPIPEVEEVEEEEEDEGSSMHWVVGSKHRAILTTQRPTKKRKLLGSDAGLDQLLVLPHYEEGPARCDVCCLKENGKKSNKIISCSSCRVLVHKKCYGVHGAVEESWVCSWCQYLEGMPDEKRGERRDSRSCMLCPKEGGALKPVGGNHNNDIEKKFAHLFCSLWTPEAYVEDIGMMEPVVNVGGVPEMRTKLVCNVCKVKHGVCVRCSYGTCRTAFHPICAREARHQMEIWGKFGCDNVELRASCSKHSTSQDVGSTQRTRNHTRTVADDSSVVKPPRATLRPNKLHNLRLTRKNKEKNMIQAELTGSVSNEVVNNEATTEQDALAINLSSENGDMKSSKDIDVGITEGDNTLPDNLNIIRLVKKLIDRGKVSVDDVASAIGISSYSLEAALMDELSSFPSEWRWKIIKWLQETAYMPPSMRHLKFRNGSAISSGSLAATVDCPDAADVSVLDIPTSSKVPGSDNAGACSVESSPARTQIMIYIKILKRNKVVCSSGEKMQLHSNEKLVDESSQDLLIHTCDTKKDANDAQEDATDEMSPIHVQGRCKDQVLLEKLTEDACTPSNPSTQVLPTEVEGNFATEEKNELSETQQNPGCTVESVFSKKLDIGQVDETNIQQDDTVKKERIGGSCSRSYIHPYIQKRLMQVQKGVPSKLETSKSNSNGHRKDRWLSTNASDSCNQHLSLVSTDVDQNLDPRQFDQLAKAKQMRILELSPEDEVEGELLYLQQKLLDNDFAIKNSFENLLGRVVKRLPQELDALKKQRWDLVLVNQFLHEVREAKKRGRKERRHREAQAVLAAATAVAASSSRNSLLRNDGTDEIGYRQLESPQKVSALPVRAAGQPSLGPRLKEAPRSAIVKVSPDKNSGLPQFQKFSKESALSCDICSRPKTMLNRIFVCSSCKVAVHLDCYRKLKDPIGPWKCEMCEEMSQSGSLRSQTVENTERSFLVVECGLCGGGNGAFRKATNGQWVHAFCAEWLLESTFRRGQQNLVDGMDAISKERDLLTCCICHQKFGVCSMCSFGHCQVAFHPACARAAGFYMNVKAIGSKFHHKAYCKKHSVEQRQKADNQQYGAEELKSIKQIRFELEKVRILCERIVKREKIKRELVLCSRDILASRRDFVAYKTFVRSSIRSPGVSSEFATTSIDNKSESATTSIENKSYSGTMQRSEDFTIDSTVSGKSSIGLSLDMNRKTDDSSTSGPTFKRKIADRTSYSGKQLPHRTQSVSFRSSADDGEKRFKSKKLVETFHKEVVMTSHQASMQNQRLPKGFVYVPIDRLSKEKPVVHDSKSHEPQKPGG